MEAKTCKQCGQIKTIDSFREYYHKTKAGKTSHYRICKSCESINTRFKYLQSKKTLTDQETRDLDQINELFELLESRGLTPPKQQHNYTPIMSLVDELLQTHRAEAARAAEVTGTTDTPAELTDWLTRELQGDPDELEEQFEVLEKKYRPQTGVDNTTFKPVFDDTYKDVLLKIEDRIEEYKDNYEW